MANSEIKSESEKSFENILDFKKKLSLFQQDELPIQTLLQHPFANSLFEFFRLFPLRYNEEHIHLTGALNAEFLFPRLKKLFDGPNKAVYEKKITDVYGPTSWPR